MVTAIFKENQRYTDVRGLWQWDYGQVLRIQGLDLPDGIEIHFSFNETGGNAMVLTGTSKDGITEVPIPNTLFVADETMMDYSFFAFIYPEDEEQGETTHKIRLYVRARPKPEDYVYTEEEFDTYKKKVDINQGVENAGKLLYVNNEGMVQPLVLDDSFTVMDGVLMLALPMLGYARLGAMKL